MQAQPERSLQAQPMAMVYLVVDDMTHLCKMVMTQVERPLPQLSNQDDESQKIVNFETIVKALSQVDNKKRLQVTLNDSKSISFVQLQSLNSFLSNYLLTSPDTCELEDVARVWALTNFSRSAED